MPSLGPFTAVLSAVLAAGLKEGPGPAGIVKDQTDEKFDSYLKSHGKSYAEKSNEYHHRRELFHKRLDQIESHNAKPGTLWKAAVNRFTDYTDEELKSLRGWRHLGGSTRQETAGHDATSPAAASLTEAEPEDQSSYPQQLSWRNLSMASDVHDQGSCGSCWAVATVTTLEAHYEIVHGKPRKFSAQELVDCVANPRHCGGKGGCDGATVELGMQWAMYRGLASSEEVAYNAETGTCKKQSLAIQAKDDKTELDADGRILTSPQLVHELTAGAIDASHAVGLMSFLTLPKNKEFDLIRAVVKHGPVAISVAAGSWFTYSSGVFDGCGKDMVVDHAVTLFGYGKTANDYKYWLIRNSWGKGWGEDGFVRLLRVDNEEGNCGEDTDPKQGVACEGGPSSVTVCGSCGILYDSVVPTLVKQPSALLEVSADGQTSSAPGAAAGSHADSSKVIRREARRN